MQVAVEVTGVTPLLMHRFPVEDFLNEKPTRKMKPAKIIPREQAEKNAYRAADGSLFLPGPAFMRSLRECGSGHKSRNSRKSLKFIMPAAVRLMDVAVKLIDPTTKKALKDFEVQIDRIVNTSTRGAGICCRPRLDVWAARFDLTIFTDMLESEQVHLVLNEAGERYGVGAFRLEKGGSYGSFRVTSWAEQKEETKAA
jgi:hypothetical protein